MPNGVVAGMRRALRTVWEWVRPRTRAMKQYARSLVENPEEERLAYEEHMRLVAKMDEARDAPPPTPDEFPRLIDDLLSDDPFRVCPARIHLEKVTAAAETLLLEAFDDPRATWTENTAESSPAGRLTRLFESIPSRTLGERIGHLADDPRWQVANPAVRSRLALGRVADLPFAFTKIVDEPTPASEGVERSIAMGWAEPAFVKGLIAWAERTTLDASMPFSYWAVRFYVKHGGPAALKALQSPHMLSVENNRNVHGVLEQLNRHGVRLPGEVVRPLLDKVLANPDVWPWECMFGDVLRALAPTDPDTATRLADEYLDGRVLRWRDPAAEFIREANGLPETWEVEPPEGMELTAAERGLVEALQYSGGVFGTVGNGGLSQYFFNSNANWRPQHVAALKAIGFEAGAAALEEASRLIHPKGASLDRDERIEQYAALSDRVEKRLDKLSELFWTPAPRLRFMLRHKELFAHIRTARRAAGLPAE
jgi:hypothetical protein